MKLKKIVIICLLLLITPTIRAIEEETDILGGKYKFGEVIETNHLREGVKHYTHKGFTSAQEGEVTDMGMNVSEEFVPNKLYPQTVNMLEIPTNAKAEIIPWAVIKNSKWQLATVRDIAADYEQLHPNKKVIAAVNGDFYDIQGGKMYPYTPHSAHAAHGDHYKSYVTYRALGFKNDNSLRPLVGNEPIIRNSLPTLELLNENNQVIEAFPIDKINTNPTDNELSVFYPKFGMASVNSQPSSMPIDVEDAYIIKGTHAIPITDVKAVYGYESDHLDFFGKGVVERFGSGQVVGNDFAIKTNNEAIKNKLTPGVSLRVQYNYTGAFEGVENMIGYNQVVMKDNQKVHSITQRAPRTMVGLKADGTIMLAVVDGRRPNAGLYGVAMAEMRALMTHYGAIDAYNLDGGGSSTLVIFDETFQVKNTISDSIERRNANALLVVVDKPVIDLDNKEITDTTVTFLPQVIDTSGYDQSLLFIKMNNEYKPIHNATFEGLTKETTYDYELLYKQGDIYVDTFIKGSLKTAKRSPSLSRIYLSYRNNDVLVTLDFKDADSTFVEGYVLIDGHAFEIKENIAILTNYKMKPLNDLTLMIKIDISDGKGIKTFDSEYKTYSDMAIVLDVSITEFLNHFNLFKEGA